jgi:hypothetical protein
VTTSFQSKGEEGQTVALLELHKFGMPSSLVEILKALRSVWSHN